MCVFRYARISCFDESTGVWNERGSGLLEIHKNHENGFYQIILRDKDTEREKLNHQSM